MLLEMKLMDADFEMVCPQFNINEPLPAGAVEIIRETDLSAEEQVAAAGMDPLSGWTKLTTFDTMSMLPQDSGRRLVSFQMLYDDLALHSSTERLQEGCCGADGVTDDKQLYVSRKVTLSDYIRALVRKMKAGFTSLQNTVTMKTRSVKRGRGMMTKRKDLNQDDLLSNVSAVSVNPP